MACGIMNIYPHPGCTVSLPVPRAFLMWGVLVGEEIGPALSSNPHSTTMTGAASLSLTVVTNLNAQTVRRHTASPTNRPTTHTQMCLSHSSFLLMAHTCNGDSNIWTCVYTHMIMFRVAVNCHFTSIWFSAGASDFRGTWSFLKW